MIWNCASSTKPEVYEYVLVYAEMPGDEPSPVTIGRWDGERWDCFDEAVACGDLNWHLDPEDITDWMELPTLPYGVASAVKRG